MSCFDLIVWTRALDDFRFLLDSLGDLLAGEDLLGFIAFAAFGFAGLILFFA